MRPSLRAASWRTVHDHQRSVIHLDEADDLRDEGVRGMSLGGLPDGIEWLVIVTPDGERYTFGPVPDSMDSTSSALSSASA